MVVPVDTKSSKMLSAIDIDAVLSNLTLPEKVSLLSGKDNWHTRDIPRCNIPSLRLSDGPNGCRGTKFFEGVPTSCFPCPSGMASTWDVELLERVGGALGDECRAKGVHVLLAPTVNMHRTPLNGRGFESFSEDPHLSGMLAGSLIRGVQGAGIGTALKHMVCNDQETDRYSVDVRVSEKVLREIYLKPFEIAIRESDPWIVMMSYNRVNGKHASETDWLISRVLRQEWAFQGMTVSDWHGTYSIDEAINAGLDLEMPGPPLVRGGALLRAINCGKVKVSQVDACVRRVLGLVNRAVKSGIPEDAAERENLYPDLDVLRQSASDAIILLRNEDGVLPLTRPMRDVAVIGPNALRAEIFGGGSAALRASYSVSPLEGLRAALGPDTNVHEARGCDSHKLTPLMGLELVNAAGQPGFDVAFYNQSPSTGVKPVYNLTTTQANMFFNDNLPNYLNKACYARVTGDFKPRKSGIYEFGVGALGVADLYVDDQLLIDNSTAPVPGDLFFGKGAREELGEIQLTAGTTYRIRVEYTSPSAATGFVGPLAFNSRGGLRFGGYHKQTSDDLIHEAVGLAKRCDAVIVVVGLNQDYETEGYDRSDMKLPAAANRLIQSILEARPDAVICLQSGTPVELPCLPSTLVQLFYNGNETGSGLAAVLLGSVNPSGKLPYTMPKRLSDSVAHASKEMFPGVDGRVSYAEGVSFGYRAWNDSLFPFGHGLSYTSFTYSCMSLERQKDLVIVRFDVTNTGSRCGREICQVYVVPPIERIQLGAFAKTKILSPGDSETLNLTVRREAFAEWKEGWLIEAGRYRLYAAASSVDIRLEDTVVIEEDIRY